MYNNTSIILGASFFLSHKPQLVTAVNNRFGACSLLQYEAQNAPSAVCNPPPCPVAARDIEDKVERSATCIPQTTCFSGIYAGPFPLIHSSPSRSQQPDFIQRSRCAGLSGNWKQTQALHVLVCSESYLRYVASAAEVCDSLDHA